MTLSLILAGLCHVIAATAIGWLVLASYRYVASRSNVVGAIFATTILVRIAMALALFWISYLRLPIAESLQLGGGFWHVFQDATGTFQNTAWAAENHRLFGLEHALSSPFFMNVTTVWMMVVGISPVAGAYLNLCLYVLLVVLIVRFFKPVNEWRRDLPCLVAITGYSLAPAVLIHSTQPVKEELSYVIVAVLCVGTLVLVRVLRERVMTREDRVAGVTAVVTIAVAIFAMAGVRWYFSFVMWGALLAVLVTFAVRRRAAPLSRYITGSIATLAVAWLAVWGGTGNNYASAAPELGGPSSPSKSARSRQIREWPSFLLLRVRMTRIGFLASGGGTNIAIPLTGDPAAGEARLKELMAADSASAFYSQRAYASARTLTSPTKSFVQSAPRVLPPQPVTTLAESSQEGNSGNPFAAIARAIPVSTSDELVAIAWGLALLFVPISLLQATGVIALEGGRGLLRVTDIDTIFLDAAIVSMLVILWARRRAIGDRIPLVVFGGILSVTAIVLLSYSVTNFGTLWRLRPMVIVPLWVMAIAVSPRGLGTTARNTARHQIKDD